MTVSDLREVLNDPDLLPDTPVRVQLGDQPPTLDADTRSMQAPGGVWELAGAYGTLAGPDRHLVLELHSAHLAAEEQP